MAYLPPGGARQALGELDAFTLQFEKRPLHILRVTGRDELAGFFVPPHVDLAAREPDTGPPAWGVSFPGVASFAKVKQRGLRSLWSHKHGVPFVSDDLET